MANLSVRHLDNRTYELLRIQAARHGISMEEEVRQILNQAVAAPEKISSLFKQYFGKDNGVDLDLENNRKPHNPMDFDE